jgi:hypothetical protein
MTSAKAELIAGSRPTLEAHLRELFDEREPPFDLDLVTVCGLKIQLHDHVPRPDEARIGKALKSMGGVKLRRMAVPVGGRTAVYVMRNHETWTAASDHKVQAYLSRSAGLKVVA